MSERVQTVLVKLVEPYLAGLELLVAPKWIEWIVELE